MGKSKKKTETPPTGDEKTAATLGLETTENQQVTDNERTIFEYGAPRTEAVEAAIEQLNDNFFSLAKELFQAYNEQAGGLTYDGKPIPPFEEVGEKVQENWKAVARYFLKKSHGIYKVSRDLSENLEIKMLIAQIEEKDSIIFGLAVGEDNDLKKVLNRYKCATCNNFKEGQCHTFETMNAIFFGSTENNHIPQGVYAQFRPNPAIFCCNQYSQRAES